MNQLHDPVAALRFLVAFAQTDFDAIGPDEYLDVLKHLQQFINRDQPRPTGTHIPDAALETFKTRAFAILDGLARTRRLAIAGDLVLSFYAIHDEATMRVQVLGSPLDRFLYQVVRVLEAVDLSKLRKCLASDCGRLFVKVTKKEYCSTRCQSRTYMRARRADEREADEKFTKGSRYGKTARTR